MENILKYYEFSPFQKDHSNSFNGNEIAYSELNSKYFLIFEKEANHYNLYVSKYKSKREIGSRPPEILELLIKKYDKSNPEHRIAIRRYLE